MNEKIKPLGLDWAAMLVEAGIPEPPGRAETIADIKAFKKQETNPLTSRRKEQ